MRTDGRGATIKTEETEHYSNDSAERRSWLGPGQQWFSETETVDGMDIGYRRERSNDKIQNFWLEHKDRVVVYELGKMRGD